MSRRMRADSFGPRRRRGGRFAAEGGEVTANFE
jgi:hypothetical protein